MANRVLGLFTRRLSESDAQGSALLRPPVTAELGRHAEHAWLNFSLPSSDEAALLIMRALAEALDVTHGHRIAPLWSTRGRTILRPGDIVPVFSPFADHDFKTDYGQPIGTPPFRLNDSVDALHNAVLVPSALPHSVHLLSQPAWLALDAIDARTTIACVVPSGADALALGTINHETKRFFGTAPANATEQLKRVLDLLKKADERRAGIVLLPELCLDSAGVRAAAQWVTDEAKHIAIAICGSHHALTERGPSNVALIASPFAPTLEQAKLVAVIWKDKAGQMLREDIERNDTPLLLISGLRWSLLVLICRDFIDVQLGSLATALRSSLVLVPACSPRTSDFVASATSLSSKAQAHTIMANQCDVGADDPDLAMISRPLNSSNDTVIRLSRKGCTLPAIALTNLNQGSWILEE